MVKERVWQILLLIRLRSVLNFRKHFQAWLANVCSNWTFAISFLFQEAKMQNILQDCVLQQESQTGLKTLHF